MNASAPTNTTLYPGIVVTCIAVENMGDNRVEFRGRIDHVPNDDENDETQNGNVAFLENVTMVRMEENGKVPIFQADQLTVKEVKASFTNAAASQPLFCIHGFNVLPESHLEECARHRGKFTKYHLIPVIWPSEGKLLGYEKDRKHAMAAGKVFRHLQRYAGLFPKKSILAHSMGNRVLRYLADEHYKFDNIFMVAADVDKWLFDEEYVSGDTTSTRTLVDLHNSDGSQDGKILKRMLRVGGPWNDPKIYILYNRNDYALNASNAKKGFRKPRLGASGVNEDNLDDGMKEFVENLDCGKSWLNWTRHFASHGYQWDDQAIEFYESKI